METKNKTKRYASAILNIALGASAVVGGAYVFSRMKEKQDTETRLERMEQILDALSKQRESVKEEKV